MAYFRPKYDIINAQIWNGDQELMKQHYPYFTVIDDILYLHCDYEGNHNGKGAKIGDYIIRYDDGTARIEECELFRQNMVPFDMDKFVVPLKPRKVI